MSTLSATTPLSDQDFDVAARLVEELERNGRADDATVLLKLVSQAEAARQDHTWSADDLTPDDVAAVERGEADVTAGRVIPHEIVKQGPIAAETYRRRRDAPRRQK